MKKALFILNLFVLGLLVSAFSSSKMDDCIGTAKYINGLSSQGAIKLCSGVKDLEALKDCAGKIKYSGSIVDEADVINACAQSQVLRVIE
jgi:hypothetical protein